MLDISPPPPPLFPYTDQDRPAWSKDTSIKRRSHRPQVYQRTNRTWTDKTDAEQPRTTTSYQATIIIITITFFLSMMENIISQHPPSTDACPIFRRFPLPPTKNTKSYIDRNMHENGKNRPRPEKTGPIQPQHIPKPEKKQYETSFRHATSPFQAKKTENETKIFFTIFSLPRQ